MENYTLNIDDISKSELFFYSDISELMYSENSLLIIDRNLLDSPIIKNSSLMSLPHFILDADEKLKNQETVNKIYDFLFDKSADRKTNLLVVGGGITLDIAGYAAATFMRGIPVCYIPTSLLAMVDASVGGKTGVNAIFKGKMYKNLIGSIRQPKSVTFIIDFLNTLADREYNAGLAEAIKTALIYDYELFDYISTNKELIKEKDKKALEHIINYCVKIKGEIVKKDQHESGLRKILNFGHTFAHAIESFYQEKDRDILHGEAVSIGMMIAIRISTIKLNFDLNLVEDIEKLLNYFELPTSFKEYNIEDFIKYIQKDKKKSSDKTSMILLKEIGNTSEVQFSKEELSNIYNSLI